MSNTNWSTLSKKRVATILKTDLHEGLSSSEVQQRVSKYGKNVFDEAERQTLLGRLLAQFKNPLVFILLVAGVATLALGERVDTIVIFVALFVNVGIGLFQEERASRAFEKLASSQEHTAVVVRNGIKTIVPAETLVPGDIVVLRAGAQVPADIYLLEARGLETAEAALTGESVPISKEVEVSKKEVPITDQRNMAWMGTLVAAGDGVGVVVGTGNNTEIGRIAEGLSDTDETQTPIQKNIKRLARFLSLLIVGIVVVIFLLGVARGESIQSMILLSIAVAVSVIPEGLPAAVTAILAIGMEKILARGGLVRNLLAAETLGSTTIILTDKTGTLTQARMRLALIVTAGSMSEQKLSADATRALQAAIKVSDAFVEEGENGERIVHGRPIERAVVERGYEEGMRQQRLLAAEPREDFLPFDSRNRFAVSLHARGEERMLYISGAPGTLLSAAKHILRDGKEELLTQRDREYFRKQLNVYARKGVRLTAVGYKKTFVKSIPEVRNVKEADKVLDGLVFTGLFGFEDPIRIDVPQAIRTAKEAGAEIYMLTGDNPETALSIAVDAGIAEVDAHVYRGSDLEKMDDVALRTTLKQTRVFARMLPEQKLRIVKILQEDDEVVAMTGDGVNDAPALQRANIGVAVGSGTEVAQEASDLILLNDSFSIIVGAIEEGRRIIDNLKKAVAHLLSTSFGEVFVIAGGIAFGLPLPILAVQILWLNIIEEGLLTFGFAFEPAEDGIMKRNPRSIRAKGVVTKEMRTLIMAAGTATGIVVLALYLLLLQLSFPVDVVRTIVFTALSLDAIFFAISLKNFYRPIWRVKLFSNKFLVVALGISITLLVASRTVPLLQEFLQIVPFTKTSLLILAGVAVLDVLIIELAKYFLFGRKRPK